MGIDYYRCTLCDLQVNDCIPYYNDCNTCGSIICWNCTYSHGISEESDGESPPKPISNSPFKMKLIIEDQESYDESEGEDGGCFELLTCPMCDAVSEEKQREAVLKYLLKKSDLTFKQAIEEMSNG